MVSDPEGGIVAFDINDRTTWAWANNGRVASDWADENGLALNPEDKNSFYQLSNGVPYRHSCPEGQVFDPRISVCSYPGEVTEAEIYAWAVDRGLVEDQR